MATPTAAKPDRFTGLPPGVAVGPLGRRVLAYLVDALVPALILLVTVVLPGAGDGTAPVGAQVAGGLLVLAWALVSWWMLATRAASPGMRLLALQLVGFTDGRPVGWGRVLVRALVFALLAATGLGLLLMLVFLLRHPRRQGWHDLAADGVVIRARALAPRAASAGAKPAGPRAAPPPQSRPAAMPAGSSGPPAAPTAAAEPVPAAAAGAPAPAPHARGATAEAPQAAVPPVRRWLAQLDDGRELPLHGRMILGRNPQPRPGDEGAELVKVADESRTVSKSHLAVAVDERGVFVVDLGSTNGSVLTTASGEVSRCAAGETVRLAEGSTISMGDRWLKVRPVASDGPNGLRGPR